jgi:hypothetical protein
MTTIAYRHPFLAADTRAVSGYICVGEVVKIARRDDGDMCGAAGDATYNYAFIQWFLAGEVGDPPKANESDNSTDRGVIFRKDGSFTIFEAHGKFELSGPYYALGSGKEVAVGAMFWGHSAEEAVMAAIEHDPGTGGKITVLRHEG